DQEELIHLISNYSKISLYQHHLTKSLYSLHIFGNCLSLSLDLNKNTSSNINHLVFYDNFVSCFDDNIPLLSV
ncbi:hypothetical protein LC973_13800, partial [Enterococcus faecium]|nr:hypothetical protein [Enterococcus faecium]